MKMPPLHLLRKDDIGGRRHSVDVCACSTFDAAHLFITHTKADPRNGIPPPSLSTVFEVVIDGKVHRVEGKALQRWILKERQRAERARRFFVFTEAGVGVMFLPDAKKGRRRYTDGKPCPGKGRGYPG